MLNITLPASSISPAQIVDNLARTLYEINQNAQYLLIPSATNNEEETKHFRKVG